MKINLPVINEEVAVPEGEVIISITNTKGVISYINQSFEDISGFTKEELLGKSHNIVRHPDMPPEAFDDLWKTLKAGKPWLGLVKNRCKNGSYYWVEAYVSPNYESGELTGYQSVRVKPNPADCGRASKYYQHRQKVTRLPSLRTRNSR